LTVSFEPQRKAEGVVGGSATCRNDTFDMECRHRRNGVSKVSLRYFRESNKGVVSFTRKS